MAESQPKLSSFFIVNPHDEHYGQECRVEPPTTDELREGRILATFADGSQQEYTNSQQTGKMPDVAHLGASAVKRMAEVSERLQAVRGDLSQLHAEKTIDWPGFHSLMSKVLDTEPIHAEIDYDQER